MTKNKGEVVKLDLRFLNDSKMSYPTWDIICNELIIDKVALTLFGDKPISYDTPPIYTNIKRTDIDTPCGIDIPILLEPNEESKGLIIILGESALRTDDDINKITQTTYNTILGTPYAIHLQKCPPKCAVYWKIFDALLEKGYSLYITDIIKIWWKGKQLKPYDLDINIFEQEFGKLESFTGKKPVLVAWGKKSQDALQQRMKKEPDTDYLPLPHPGVNNWDSWKLRIFMKAVFNDNLEYATNVYGKGDIGNENKTDEGIVADEAVRSIIEYLNKMESKGNLIKNVYT